MFFRKFQALSGKSEFFLLLFYSGRAGGEGAESGSAVCKPRQRFSEKDVALFPQRCRTFPGPMQGFFCRGAPEVAAAGGGEGSSGFPGGGVEDGLLCAFVVDLGRLVEEISVCRECFWRKRACGAIFVLPERAVGSAGGNH